VDDSRLGAQTSSAIWECLDDLARGEERAARPGTVIIISRGAGDIQTAHASVWRRGR